MGDGKYMKVIQNANLKIQNDSPKLNIFDFKFSF
jgi:hypothetical protein